VGQHQARRALSSPALEIKLHSENYAKCLLVSFFRNPLNTVKFRSDSRVFDSDSRSASNICQQRNATTVICDVQNTRPREAHATLTFHSCRYDTARAEMEARELTTELGRLAHLHDIVRAKRGAAPGNCFQVGLFFFTMLV
jgi:hypothetical protein